MAANPDTQSTVEAAAIAAYAAVNAHKGWSYKWENLSDDGKEEWRIVARAALAAQPRDDVREAAIKARDYLKSGVPAEYSPDNIYLALDAALSTDSGPTEEQAASDGVPAVIWLYPEQGDPEAGEWSWVADELKGDPDDFRNAIRYTRLRTPDERDRALEEAAKVADERAEAYLKIPAPHLLNAARQGEAERIAANIRALKGPEIHTPAERDRAEALADLIAMADDTDMSDAEVGNFVRVYRKTLAGEKQ